MQVNNTGNNPEPQKYTMEQLGIKDGTKEASIFNEIDRADGQKDGRLTKEQVEKLFDRMKNEILQQKANEGFDDSHQNQSESEEFKDLLG